MYLHLIREAKSKGKGGRSGCKPFCTADSACRYAYGFDDIGNRETSSERGTNSVYTANQLNQYVAVDDFVPQFDDDGNQTLVKTATGIWSVAYNGENRPVRWESGNAIVTMSFDRMGRRVTKNDQRFVYDGYLQIADNNGNAYIWDPTEKVATRPLVWNSSTFQTFNFSTAYYTHDGNKNVSEVITPGGGIDAHYDYTPFGAVVAQSGTSAAANPWRFSSEFAEDDTATVYYNYRHYEPKTGRWMKRDPIGERGGIGLYSFVGNLKSMIARDRLGLVQWAIDGIAFTLPEFFTEAPAEKNIYKYVNVNAEYSSYKSGIHYSVRFIPRFSRPPDIDKEYGGRTPDGNSSLGGDKGAFQPDELEGDMPSDYWGDPEVTDYTKPDGWKQKSFRYKN